LAPANFPCLHEAKEKKQVEGQQVRQKYSWNAHFLKVQLNQWNKTY
jgi:hypothetical protein